MNFPFTPTFIQVLGKIKDAVARQQIIKLLPTNKQRAISKAAKEVWQNKHGKQFPIDVFQTGSGTSTNMNANEVIANLASKYSKLDINPNDDVNMSQSSNDVIPTAMHCAYYVDTAEKLMPAMDLLIDTIAKKIAQYHGVVKTGRTHLMDAMPLTIDQELGAWNTQLLNVRASLITVLDALRFLPQGGTAVGTGINAHPRFAREFCKAISPLVGFEAETSNDYFRNLSSQDLSVQLSGELKNLAVILMKISNDLR